MISRENLDALGIEYVSGSADGRRQGYYRKIPRTRQDPTQRQVEHRIKFAEIAYETFGERGVVNTQDDRQIPQNANTIANKLKGTGQPKKVPSPREKLMRLILEG